MGCGSSSTVVPTVIDTDTVIESINNDSDTIRKYRTCSNVFSLLLLNL